MGDIITGQPEAVQVASVGDTVPVSSTSPIVPLPSLPPLPVSRHAYVVINDDKAIMALIEVLLDRAGLTQAEVARRLGVKTTTVNQYRWLRKKHPSIRWITRLAEVCGARLVVEWPQR